MRCCPLRIANEKGDRICAEDKESGFLSANSVVQDYEARFHRHSGPESSRKLRAPISRTSRLFAHLHALEPKLS